MLNVYRESVCHTQGKYIQNSSFMKQMLITYLKNIKRVKQMFLVYTKNIQHLEKSRDKKSIF